MNTDSHSILGIFSFARRSRLSSIDYNLSKTGLAHNLVRSQIHQPTKLMFFEVESSVRKTVDPYSFSLQLADQVLNVEYYILPRLVVGKLNSITKAVADPPADALQAVLGAALLKRDDVLFTGTRNVGIAGVHEERDATRVDFLVIEEPYTSYQVVIHNTTRSVLQAFSFVLDDALKAVPHLQLDIEQLRGRVVQTDSAMEVYRKMYQVDTWDYGYGYSPSIHVIEFPTRQLPILNKLTITLLDHRGARLRNLHLDATVPLDSHCDCPNSPKPSCRCTYNRHPFNPAFSWAFKLVLGVRERSITTPFFH